MKRTWNLTCLVLGFFLQVLAILAGNLDDCEESQFLLNGNTNCRTCPACPAGQMYTTHCGYQQDHRGNIYKPRPSCQPCDKYSYKSKHSIVCQECSSECPRNRVMVYPCNATHDLKCETCKEGFYTVDDGSCLPCSHCCGNIFDNNFSKQFVKQECVDARMGDCSCRPLKGCTKKCPTTTTTLSPLGKTTAISSHTLKENTRQTVSNKLTSPIANKTIRQTVSSKPTSPIANKTIKLHSNTQVARQRFAESEVPNQGEIGYVDPGWLVAVAIGVLLLSVVVFSILKHFNILKKIKILLQRQSSDAEHGARDHFLDSDVDETTVVTVRDRFESPAPLSITNYAQLVCNEDNDDQSDSFTLPNHVVINRGAQPMVCSCHHSEPSNQVSCNHTELISDDQDGPWVYRRQPDHRQPKTWLPSRAEIGGSAAVLYGEYVELHRNEEATQGNTAGNSAPVEKPSNMSAPQENQKPDTNEEMSVEEKSGDENSEAEETATAVPVTVAAGEEHIVVIATGQHSGIITSQDAKECSKIKNEGSKGKRKKKQPVMKKSRKLSDDMDEISSESLQCTCGKCSYRPYVREMQLCHCTNCVPQPDDDLYKIIERRCLRAEICQELNKKGVPNWHDLSIYIRIDKLISNIERNDNPADIVLEKLKASRPRLKLEDFNGILKKIRRHDVMDVIMNHHVTCLLCRRNSFDGSLQNLYLEKL